MLRYVFAAVVALSLPMLSSAQCHTTRAPNPPFVPPAPYPSIPSESQFWYGTDDLWTALGDGKWTRRGNGNSANGRGYTEKLIFWRKGFNWRTEMEPKLVVTVKRLDGDAPIVTVAHANAVFVTGNRPAMMSLIKIPTAGCWEITAHYNSHNLTFVVSIEP